MTSHQFSAETWTRAKSLDSDANEDVLFADSTVIALADGATDKSGIEYLSGKTGGRELAELATQIAATSEKSGYVLTDEITGRIREFYTDNNSEALDDKSKRASTTLAVARLIGNYVVITQVGDTNIRVTRHDGSIDIFTNDKDIDYENAKLRAQAIYAGFEQFQKQFERVPSVRETQKIIDAGRDAIDTNLHNQYRLQNNASEIDGYGTIDGSDIPQQFRKGNPTDFVKTMQYEAGEIATIELVSDGFYGQFPEVVSIEAYKRLYQDIHRRDPYKYLEYLSTKSRDDASVAIARLV